MEIIECPEPTCIAPAEILDRFTLPATTGPTQFVKVLCLHRHWFALPVQALKYPRTAIYLRGRNKGRA